MNQKYLMISLVLTVICISQYVTCEQCTTSTTKLKELARRACGTLEIRDIVDTPKKRGAHDKDTLHHHERPPFYAIYHEGGQINFSLVDHSGFRGNRLRRNLNTKVKVDVECNNKVDSFIC